MKLELLYRAADFENIESDEQIIDGVSFQITLDENGKASLVYVKDGKQCLLMRIVQ